MKKLKQTLKNIGILNLVQIVVAFAMIIAPVVLPQVVEAQGLIGQFASQCPQDTGLNCGPTSIAGIFKLVINWALAIAFIAAVIILIYGGFLYITSAGNTDQAGKGKTAIFNALIGIVIIVLSYTIVQIVYRFISGSSSGALGS